MDKKKHKPIKLKHFSDLKMHAPPVSSMTPFDHPAFNSQSGGTQMMAPQDSAMNQSHPDIPGGGNTGMM